MSLRAFVPVVCASLYGPLVVVAAAQAPPTVRLASGYRASGRGELGRARASAWSGHASASLFLQPGAGTIALTELRGEYTRYRFRDAGAGNPGVGLPVTGSLTLSGTQTMLVAMGPRWAIGAGGVLGVGREEGARLSRSLEYGGFGFLRYSRDPRFGLSLGLIYLTRLEDDPLVLPLVALEWAPTNRVAVELRGTTAAVRYRASRSWSVGLTGAYERDNVRLDAGGPLPSGIWRREAAAVELELAFTPLSAWDVVLTGGILAGQRYRLADADGREQWRASQPVLPTLGIRTELRW